MDENFNHVLDSYAANTEKIAAVVSRLKPVIISALQYDLINE